MPRPSKKTELISIPLEIATVKLSNLEKFHHPIIALRIRQAITRHPDLENLLRPVLDELAAHSLNVSTAKAAINTAKSLVKKISDQHG